MRRIPIMCTLALWAFILPLTCAAGQWAAELSRYSGAPEKLFVVEKSSQTIFLLAAQSPLEVLSSQNCTTGQAWGDKAREGDLRTPEGVYFLEEKIRRSLDEGLYGNLAYRLNYPNPVDRMQGKTGSGIWLHGRGWSITPRETRGCVALNTDGLRALESDIQPGVTPVVMAESVTLDVENHQLQTEAIALADRVRAWAGAWGAKSDAFFDYYNATLFSQSSGRPFSHFASRKKNLFVRHDWIQVFIHDLRLIPGPGYWVSAFEQYYRTPTFTSQGVKRLYWQESDGVLKIVGSEWVDLPLQMEENYLSASNSQLKEFFYAWCLADLTGDLDGLGAMYAGEQPLRNKEEAGYDGVDILSMRTSIHPKGVEIVADLHYRKGKIAEEIMQKRLVVAPYPQGWRIVDEREKR